MILRDAAGQPSSIGKRCADYTNAANCSLENSPSTLQSSPKRFPQRWKSSACVHRIKIRNKILHCSSLKKTVLLYLENCKKVLGNKSVWRTMKNFDNLVHEVENSVLFWQSFRQVRKIEKFWTFEIIIRNFRSFLNFRIIDRYLKFSMRKFIQRFKMPSMFHRTEISIQISNIPRILRVSTI